MFGSYYVELGFGLAFLCIAAGLWRYLLYAFRRVPVPALFRNSMAAELSTVMEIALLAFGTAFVIDAAVKVL